MTERSAAKNGSFQNFGGFLTYPHLLLSVPCTRLSDTSVCKPLVPYFWSVVWHVRSYFAPNFGRFWLLYSRWFTEYDFITKKCDVELLACLLVNLRPTHSGYDFPTHKFSVHLKEWSGPFLFIVFPFVVYSYDFLEKASKRLWMLESRFRVLGNRISRCPLEIDIAESSTTRLRSIFFFNKPNT